MAGNTTEKAATYMAYNLPDTWSLETIIDYLWAIQAGLEADPALADQAGAWLALEARLVAERTTRDAARKALVKAASAQRRKDLNWDKVIKRIGTRSFADAERNAKRPPYAILFGSIRPSDATRLGAIKARELGAGLALKMRELKQADYDGLATQLEAASAELDAADKTRKTRAAEAQTHDVRRRALIEEVEALIDKTQIAILTAYRGESDLVRTILSPWKDASSVNREETPTTPSGDAPEAEG